MQLPNNKLLLIGAGIILLIIIITLILPIINTQTTIQNFSFSEFEMSKTIIIQGENRTETYTFNTQNPVVGYLIIPKTIATSVSEIQISGDYLIQIIEEDPILFIEQKEYTPGTKTITIQTKTGDVKHSTILLPINLTDYQAFSENETYELNQTIKQFNQIDENYYTIEETKKIIEEFAQGTASAELKKKVNENGKLFFSENEISLHNDSLKQILKLRQIENTTTNTPNNSKFKLTGSTLNSTISSLITPRLKKETTTQNEFEYSLEITFSKQITSQIPEQIIIPFSKNQEETSWTGEIILTQDQIPLEEDLEFEIITNNNIIASFEKKEISKDYIKFNLEVKINPSNFQTQTIIYEEISIQPKKLFTSPITIPLTLIKNNCNYSNNSLLYPLIKEDSEEYLRKISTQAILCLIIETDQEINQIIDSNTPNFPLNLELFEIEDNLLLQSIMLNDLDSYKEILKRKKELISEEQLMTLNEKKKLENITNQIFNLIDNKQIQARDYYDFLNNEILTFTYLTESYFNRIQLLLDPDKNIFRENYIKNRTNYFALQSEDSESSIEKKVNDELNYYFGSGNSEKIEILKIEKGRLELEIKTLNEAIVDIREGKFDDASITKSISEWWGVLIRDKTRQDLIDSFWESEEIIKEEISELNFQLVGINNIILQMEKENKTLIEIYENNYTKSKDILSGKLIEDGAFRNKVVSGLVKQINLLRFNEHINNQIDALALYQDIQTINYFKTNEVMHQIIYEQKIDEKENPNNPIYLWKKVSNIWTNKLTTYCEIEKQKVCEIEKQRIGMNKIIDQILKGKNLIEIQKENEYVFSEQEEIKPSEDDWYIKAALENLPIQLEIEKEEIMLANFINKKEQYEKAKTNEEKMEILLPKETQGDLALNLAEYYLTIGLTDVAREQYEQIQLEYTAFPKIISKARSLERKDVWWTVKNATTQYTKSFFTTDRIITYAIFSFTFRAVGRAQATRQYKSESINTWEVTKLRAKVPWEKQHFSKLPSSSANTSNPILNGDLTVEVLSSPSKIPKVANKVTGKDGFFETQQVGNYQIQSVDGMAKINFRPAQTQTQGSYKISYEGGQPRFDFYKTGNYNWVKSQPSGGISGGSFRATTQPSIGGKSGFVKTTTQTMNTTKLNSPFAKIKATQSSGITSPQTGISTPQTTFETVGNLALQPSTLDLTYLNSSIASSPISSSIQPILTQPTGLFATPLISSIGLFLEERRQLNNLYQNYQATIIQTSQVEYNNEIPAGIKNTLLLHQQLISQQNKIDQIICPNCKAIIEIPSESEKIPLEFSTAIFDPELPLTIGEIKFENKLIENLNVKIIISSKNTTPTWTITLEGKTPTLLILSPIEPEIILQNNVEIKKEIFSINEDGLVQTGGLVSQTKAASTTLFIEDEEGNITTVQVDLDIATARNTYQGLGTIVGAFDNSEFSGSETKSNLANEKTPDFASMDTKINQVISSKPEFEVEIPIEGTNLTINRRSFTGSLGSADIYYLIDKQTNLIYVVKKLIPKGEAGRDREEFRGMIPGRTEFERFSEIPKELINTGHLNPILYNSPNNNFYIAKLVEGYEDEEIFLHLSPEEAGLKLFELAYLVAKNNVITADVIFQTGHNIIYNNETGKLMLFDHGAQYYDPSVSSIEISETLIQQIISRNANLQTQLEKNLETGKVEMSEKAKNKIIMGYYFITNLAQKLGLTKMPLNRVSTERPDNAGFIFTNENYVPIPKTFEEYLGQINQILPEKLYVPAFRETIQKSELEELLNNSFKNYKTSQLINSANNKTPTISLSPGETLFATQCQEGCVVKTGISSDEEITQTTKIGVLTQTASRKIISTPRYIIHFTSNENYEKILASGILEARTNPDNFELGLNDELVSSRNYIVGIFPEEYQNWKEVGLIDRLNQYTSGEVILLVPITNQEGIFVRDHSLLSPVRLKQDYGIDVLDYDYIDSLYNKNGDPTEEGIKIEQIIKTAKEKYYQEYYSSSVPLKDYKGNYKAPEVWIPNNFPVKDIQKVTETQLATFLNNLLLVQNKAITSGATQIDLDRVESIVFKNNFPSAEITETFEPLQIEKSIFLPSGKARVRTSLNKPIINPENNVTIGLDDIYERSTYYDSITKEITIDKSDIYFPGKISHELFHSWFDSLNTAQKNKIIAAFEKEVGALHMLYTIGHKWTQSNKNYFTLQDGSLNHELIANEYIATLIEDGTELPKDLKKALTEMGFNLNLLKTETKKLLTQMQIVLGDFYESEPTILQKILNFTCHSPCVWENGSPIKIVDELDKLEIKGDFSQIGKTQIVQYSPKLVISKGIAQALQGAPNLEPTLVAQIENAMKEGKTIATIQDLVDRQNIIIYTSNPSLEQFIFDEQGAKIISTQTIQKEFNVNDFSALSRAKTNSLQLQLEISRIFREAINIYLTPKERVGAGVVVSGSIAREEAGMSDVDLGLVLPNASALKHNQVYGHIVDELERSEYEVDPITEIAMKQGIRGDTGVETNLLDLTLVTGDKSILTEINNLEQNLFNSSNFGNEVKELLDDFTSIADYSDWTVKGNKRELDYLLFYLKWKYQTAGKPTVQTINELIKKGAITSEEGNIILTQLDEMINIRQKLDLIKLRYSPQEVNDFKLRNGKSAFDEGYVEGFSVKLADELGFDTVEEFETYYKNVVKENRTIINNIMERFK